MEATDEQYASFGKVVTGIMDGFTFNGSGDALTDNASVVLAIQMLAPNFGIEFKDPYNSERYGTKA